jgi:hypothetical protein
VKDGLPDVAADDCSNASRNPDYLKGMTLIALAPNHNAAAIVNAFTGDTFGETNPLVIAAELKRQCEDVQGGDMKRIEATLLSQAHSLDVMFASLARRASQQSDLRKLEAYMRLALRAQSQCRATLEALATIKNPAIVIAKQANISHGHQQVNNGAEVQPARTEQIETGPNRLLESDHGQRLDTRATGAAGRGDQAVEAVEVVDRPEND